MSSDVGMAALAMAIVMLLLPRVLGPDAVDAELVKAGLCTGRVVVAAAVMVCFGLGGGAPRGRLLVPTSTGAHRVRCSSTWACSSTQSPGQAHPTG